MSLQEKTTIQTGMIIPYLGGVNVSPPDGWLYCDYSLQNNSSYPDLATLISGVYGVSPDPAKFRLPGPMTIMQGNPTLSFFSGEGYKLQTSLHSHSATNANASIALNSASHNHTMTTPVSNSSTAKGHGHGAADAANGNLDIVNNLSNESSVATSNSNPPYISIASATFGSLYADDGHKHTLNTSVPTSNTFASHTHAGTAGTIASTNTHSHTLARSVSISSDVAVDTDYPPYIFIWHIIKT